MDGSALGRNGPKVFALSSIVGRHSGPLTTVRNRLMFGYKGQPIATSQESVRHEWLQHVVPMSDSINSSLLFTPSWLHRRFHFKSY